MGDHYKCRSCHTREITHVDLCDVCEGDAQRADAMVAGGLIARDELIVAWVAEKVEVPEGAWTGATITVEDYGL